MKYQESEYNKTKIPVSWYTRERCALMSISSDVSRSRYPGSGVVGGGEIRRCGGCYSNSCLDGCESQVLTLLTRVCPWRCVGRHETGVRAGVTRWDRDMAFYGAWQEGLSKACNFHPEWASSSHPSQPPIASPIRFYTEITPPMPLTICLVPLPIRGHLYISSRGACSHPRHWPLIFSPFLSEAVGQSQSLGVPFDVTLDIRAYFICRG